MIKSDYLAGNEGELIIFEENSVCTVCTFSNYVDVSVSGSRIAQFSTKAILNKIFLCGFAIPSQQVFSHIVTGLPGLNQY